MISNRVKRSVDGQKVVDTEVATDAEIQGAGISPLPFMRPEPGVPEEIQNVPDLFPGAESPGRHSRRDQIKLVKGGPI